MSQIILVAETGADIPPELAAQYNIRTVPMHVSFGGTTRDDGTFPSDEVCSYYERVRELPRTSGSTPEDFTRVFDQLHTEHPEAHILHLAYSAVTTCSYQSAKIAAEELIARARMRFIPNELEYLRAGGRVSNAAAMCGKLLGIHPLIELKDGYLVATKKLRGKLDKLAPRLVQDFADSACLEREELWLVWTPGFPGTLRAPVEKIARHCGFQTIMWIKAGGVITTHGGPSALGVAGFMKNRRGGTDA